MRAFYIFLLLLIFSSCYTTRIVPISENMNRYMGKTEHEIIIIFGAPNNITTDGAGGKILVYTQSQSQSNTLYGTIYANQNLAITNTYDNSQYVQFYISEKGIVYNWRTNYPDQVIREPKKIKRSSIKVFGVMILVIGIMIAIPSFLMKLN